MKKYLVMALIFFVPTTIYAGQYFGISAGTDYCYRTDDNDHGQKVGYKVGANYGYRFENGIRAEFEIVYRDGHKRTTYVYSDGGDDQKTHASYHSMSYMANGLYDIVDLSTYGVVPYAGLGVGVCSNSFESKTQKGTHTNRDKGKNDRFAYQLIVGGKYPVAEKMELFGEYKYFVGMYHAKNHSFSLGLVRSF